MSSWKAFERRMAALFETTRHPANQGGRVDFTGQGVIGQCKEVKTMSLERITQLVEEMDSLAGANRIGVVCVKVRRGRGQASPALVVVSAETWARLIQSAQTPIVLESTFPEGGPSETPMGTRTEPGP